LKGKQIPLITTEAGVGRGLQPVTIIENVNGGQGGNTVTSYAPAASYITNKQRGLLFNPNNVGYADFTAKTTSRLLYWHATTISGTILSAPTPIELS
jgi:alpha-glucosidase